MKKIALLGNCQLQQIGWLLKNFFAQHQLPFEVVWYEPIYALGDTQAPIVPLFHALQQADVIYGQFHDGKWNALSTESLRRQFEIRLVPTLESLASYPQMNYFSQGKLNFQLYTVDFRLLDLYIAGATPQQACAQYGDVRLGGLDALVDETVGKYARLHAQGKVAFDYAPEYRRLVDADGLGAYFVHNHPNNSQLQWLANQILRDLGSPTLLGLQNLPEILLDTQVPALGRPTDAATPYRLRSVDVGLAAACKVYDAFFSSYDRGFLREELAQCVYTRLRTAAAQPALAAAVPRPVEPVPLAA